MLGYYHYGRWLSVHDRAMQFHRKNQPARAQKCDDDGQFVVHKANTDFPSIAIDQVHEQNNALIKGDGGVVGLMDNLAALFRWTVAGPEICRVVGEFADAMKTSK